MQKIKTLTYQIVVNCGNYETIRFGCEWTPSSDDFESETTAMDAELKRIATGIIAERNKTVTPSAPTQTPTSSALKSKEVLTLDSPKLQAICNKLNGGTPLATVLEHFEPADEKVMNVLKLAEWSK